jgi:hypothetical protein
MQNARMFCLVLNKFTFSCQIFIKVSNTKFHRIRPAGAALIHADRWIDMNETEDLRVYANVPKMNMEEPTYIYQCAFSPQV